VAPLVEAELDPAGEGDGRQQAPALALIRLATLTPSAWRAATMAVT